MKARTMKKINSNNKIVYLTQNTLTQYREELHDLVNHKRQAVSARIQTAREYGDLSENAEYDAAKNEQSFIEGRITELEQMLANVIVINTSSKSNLIQLGSKVTVHLNGKDDIFTIVDAPEANPVQKRISHKSPLGKELVGRKVGDNVEVHAPAGKLTYKVVSIE